MELNAEHGAYCKFSLSLCHSPLLACSLSQICIFVIYMSICVYINIYRYIYVYVIYLKMAGQSEVNFNSKNVKYSTYKNIVTFLT